MRLGVHVSIAGKIYESVDRAIALKCNTFQIFSRNPRGWQKATFSIKGAEIFKQKRLNSKIFPVVIHIPYLINLTSPDESLWQRSIRAYIEDIKNADILGVEYFVTHLGSHRGLGERFGICRFANAINIIIKEARPEVKILLENTAGSGNSLGYKFEHLKMIMAKVYTENIGVCLDTAHTFEAGYPINTKIGLDKTLKEFDSIVGLNRLKVIHLNDSKTNFNSKVDRHWHIGKGKLGIEAFKRIVNHPNLFKLPFILETPKNTDRDDRNNLAVVKKIYRPIY